MRLDLINIFILISFKGKVFTQINSQQINTFKISSHVYVDCAIQINFNLDAVDKGGSSYIVNCLNTSKSFILGKFYVIRVNVNRMRIHSRIDVLDHVTYSGNLVQTELPIERKPNQITFG